MDWEASTPKHPKDDVRDRCWKLELRAGSVEDAELLAGLNLIAHEKQHDLWMKVVELTRKIRAANGWDPTLAWAVPTPEDPK